MAELKYSHRIITETKPLSPELKEKLEAEQAKRKSSIKQTRLMSVDDETHVITKSSLVCIPKGLKHCPWKFLDIKKPTLVFSAGPSAMYSGSHKSD